MAEWINDPQGREEIEKVTKELKLPVWKANHKGKFRDFWNELWDKIEDYILKLKGDTEKNSKGLNDRLISAVGKHDGDFPIANAVVGNVYYSELTKKYYKCKVAGPAPMPNGNFIDMSILENLNRLENLSIFKVQELYSTPTGIKFTVFQCGNLILVAAYTYNIEKVNYGITYKCNLPYSCHNTATAITGNNGTSGHFSLVNDVLMVSSTDIRNPLTNTFMGQLTTFLK